MEDKKLPYEQLSLEELEKIGYKPPKIGRKGGRPTKFNLEVFKVLFQRYLEEAEKNEEFINVRNFALYVGVSEDALMEYIKKDDKDCQEFHGLLKELRDLKKKQLIEGSLTRKYDGNFAKFLLSAEDGMSERRDITSKGEKVSFFEQFHEMMEKDEK